jgi:hypothetical protein
LYALTTRKLVSDLSGQMFEKSTIRDESRSTMVHSVVASMVLLKLATNAPVLPNLVILLTEPGGNLPETAIMFKARRKMAVSCAS